MARNMTNDSTASILPAAQLRPGEPSLSTFPASVGGGNGAAPDNRGRLRVVIALYLLVGLFAAFNRTPRRRFVKGRFSTWLACSRQSGVRTVGSRH